MPITLERLVLTFLIGLAIAGILTAISFFGALSFTQSIYSAKATEEVKVAVQLRQETAKIRFGSTLADIEFFARTSRLQEDFTAMANAWTQMGDEAPKILRDAYLGKADVAFDNKNTGFNITMFYQFAHSRIHAAMHRFVQRGSYGDLLMINVNGSIIYSVQKNDEFGTNLLTGPYRKSSLAKSFRQISNAFGSINYVFTDLSPYEASGNDPAGFLLVPVFDDSETFTGVIAVEIKKSIVNEIAQFDAGLLKEGRFYFVGEDFRLRSDIRDAKGPTIFEPIKLKHVAEKAFSGQRGSLEAKGYLGESAIVSYASLQFAGVTWAAIGELQMKAIHNRIDKQRIFVLSLIGGFCLATLIMFLLVEKLLFSNRRISQSDIQNIRVSWARVEKRQTEFAVQMLSLLFELDPTARAMFHTDIDRQAQRFAQALSHLINNLDKFQKMVPTLQRMGRDHAEYGVKRKHFELFGVAFLRTLNGFRGHKLTRAERDSWADFFAVTAQEMAKSME